LPERLATTDLLEWTDKDICHATNDHSLLLQPFEIQAMKYHPHQD
jgi:hypothetical protein